MTNDWVLLGSKIRGMRLLGLTLIIQIFLTGCNSEICREDVLTVQPESIEIIRTESELFESAAVEEVMDYFQKYPRLATYFWHSYQYPNDTVLASRVFELIRQPGVDTVFQESINAYEQMDDVAKDLGAAFGRLRAIYPEARVPEVYSAVTVFYNDLLVSDSLIIIGLDHFIGPDASYAPQDIPAYILKRYDKAHLAAIIMQFVSGYYVKAGDKSTLLSDMIDFGKSYYLTSRLLPCTPDSLIIGYSPENMTDIRANQEIIWANFVENQLLYETDHIQKRKFLSERPNVYEIGERCPGRIGAWVGWEIVESYMANNDVSIRELIEDTDHHKLFERAGYKPQNQ